MAFDIEAFKAQGIRLRKERDGYRASSKLWKLRERARSLKTRKAKDKAWKTFYKTFKEAFPEGSDVWIDEGLHFDCHEAGSFVTYKQGYYNIIWNSGKHIRFDLPYHDSVDFYYDPCGHDNLMALELAQRNALRNNK